MIRWGLRLEGCGIPHLAKNERDMGHPCFRGPVGFRKHFQERSRNCRSLHFATPDFLWNLVALVHFMRPSLRKGAYAALSSAVWQEIRVRSGRDDTSLATGT